MSEEKIILKRKGSIQKRILFSFISLVVVAGVIIAAVSYSSSIKTAKRELLNNVMGQTESMNYTFDMYTFHIETVLDRLVENELTLKQDEAKEDEFFQLLKETGDSDDTIVSLYRGTADQGKVIIYPYIDLDDDFDGRERPWYGDAVESAGKTVWTEPYTDVATGGLVVTAARAYYDDDDLKGVIGIDVSLDTLVDMISELEVGEHGYFVLYDREGNYLAHPNDELVGQNEADKDYFQEILQSDGQGVITLEDQGEKQTVHFKQNETTGWILGGVIFHRELDQIMKELFVPIIITLLSVILAVVLISSYISRKITNPIKIVMKRMQEIAEGDLTKDSLTIDTNDETGQLMISTNQMNESMRSLIQDIKSMTETVTTQSDHLTKTASDVQTGVSKTMTSLQELSAGSEVQANNASDISLEVASFLDHIQQVNDEGEQIKTLSEKVLEMTSEGSGLMETSSGQMDKIDYVVNDVTEKVQGLDARAQDITKLVQVIQNISEQTNLLALNAAIEAARAGEHGKGFAVVADEVRNLAEEVSHSISDITAIVESIQEESSEVTSALLAGYKEVELGTEQINLTNQKFNEISEAVSTVVDRIGVITSYLSETEKQSESMNNSIQEIASVSEESAAGIEQISGFSQEANAMMEQVEESLRELDELSQHLSSTVERFKV